MEIAYGVVLALSFLGLFAFCRRAAGAEDAFVPLTALCLVILVLFAGALAGCLLPAALALYGAGLALFGFFLIADRRAFSFILHPAFLVFCALSVGVAVCTHGVLPDQYDNYTHWALIMKTMYRTDALPTPDTLVTFTDYPPAAALFGYYVMRCTAFGEDVMLTAQGMLVSASVAAMFAGCRFCRPWRMFSAFLTAAAMLSVIPANLSNLYVDSLLGCLAAAASAMVFWNSRAAGGGQVLPVCACLSVLVLTKQSGALLAVFVVLTAFFLSLSAVKRTGAAAVFRTVLPEALFPVLFRWAFSGHVARVFGEQASSGVDASYSGALTGIASRTEAFRRTFPTQFLTALTDLGRFPIRFAACFIAAMLLCVLVLCAVRQHRGDAGWLLLALLYGAAYTAGVYFMYAAWMEEGESAQLASFERYIGTGLIFLIGFCMAALLVRPPEEDMRPMAGALFLAAFPLLLGVLWGVEASQPDEPGDSIRRDARLELSEAYELVQYRIPASDELVYCIDDRIEPGYYYYVMRYIFMRRYVWPLEPWCIEEDLWGAEQDDCLILILHTGWMTENYMLRCFGESGWAPGLYEKHGNTLTLLQPLPSFP